ncbi:MAG TPA: DUF1800 domain-containing protein [Anaerolineales bacterium]|nr:DUF1800 domain-containing protein [Anaerolineales bacterium]
MKVSRRDFIKTSGLFAAFTALAACSPQTTSHIITGHSSGSGSIARIPTAIATTTPAATAVDALAILTLNRISFGATPEMYDRVQQIGLDAFIDEQLHPETIDDDATDQLMTRFPTLTMTPAQRYQLPQFGQPVQELIAATILRQWHSQRQLKEVMVDFWSNHFNIYIGKSLCRVLKTDDDLDVIRPNAFAKFGDILNASAHSPAMLIFLDNAESQKIAPNENYARELMELHTISVNGGYTQTDITNVARAFTGWSIVGPNNLFKPFGTYQFVNRIHDTGEKQILNLTIPAGGGEDDGTQVLDMLAHHPMAAQFISTKLARRFVSDNPDPAMVTDLATIFTQSDGDTPTLLKAIFQSEAFKKSAGQKMKRPLEFLASAMRLTQATLTGPSQQLVNHVKMLGQIPFDWQFPNGFPDSASFWATTSGLLERWNFGNLLTSNKISGVQVDINALTQDAQSAQDVIDVLSQRFIGSTLPDDARDILLDFASSGDLGGKIADIAGLILGSPHFQVR